MKLRKIVAMFMAAMLVVGLLAACSSGAEEAPAEEATEEAAEEEAADDGAEAAADYSDVKIGLLLPGSANDGGWSQLAADAFNAAAEEYGVTADYTENCAPTDYESIMRGYADNGYSVVVSHGAEFLDTSKQVAPDYPDVMFITTSAMEGMSPNVAAIDFGSYQTGALTGFVAGLATESNKIGIIGALEGATTVLCFEATETAAKAVNPDVEVTIVYTGSYDDQLKAKQAAQELIAQGCDVIVENADYAGIGAIQQCDEDGAINIAQATDYRNEGESVMICVMQDVSVGIKAAIEKAIEGTLEANDGATMMGAAEGVVFPTDYNGIYADKLTDEEKALYQQVVDEAMNGGLLTEEAALAFFETLDL